MHECSDAKRLLLFVAALLFAGISSSPCADTHYVWTNSPAPLAPYTTWASAARSIQLAIDSASSGDTVLVTNGVYGVAAAVSVSKAVTVRSVSGYQYTTIDAANSNQVLYVASADAVVDGFTVTRGWTNGDGGGVYLDGGGTILNCLIVSNASLYGGGLYASTAGTASNCIIRANSCSNWGGGAFLDNGGVITACSVDNNRSTNRAGGICLYYGGQVADSTISSNMAMVSGGGVRFSIDGALSNCVLFANSAGDSGGGAYCSSGGVLDRCTLAGNTAVYDGGGVYCNFGGIVSNCVVVSNSADLGGGALLYTAGNLNASTVTCNSAATAGGGVYCYQGGDITNCTISVNWSGSSGGGIMMDSGGVVRLSIVTNNTSVSGGGAYIWQTGVIRDSEINGNTASERGGGVRLAYGGVVSNCTIGWNSSDDLGGGVICLSNGLVVACNIIGNTASYGGGGACAATVLESTIVSNRASWYGGGAYEGSLSNCSVRFNSVDYKGGGCAAARVRQCTVSSNSAEYGGGVAEGSTVWGSILTGNRASMGGGADVSDIQDSFLYGNRSDSVAGGAYRSILRNCTLTGNKSLYAGGVESASCLNCIVYGNSAYYEGDNYRADCGNAFTNTCTVPLPEGAGNFTNSPCLFAMGRPNISSNSPCVDAGAALYAFGQYDIDGEARLGGAGIDVGCDEFISAGGTGALQTAVSANATNVCVSVPLHFVAQVGGKAWGAEWSFGDGKAITNEYDTRHAYSATGNYQVVLRAWNQSGAAATTVGVYVVGGFTNYVALSGTHAAPYTNWTQAATNIQAAVLEAAAGGTIIVGPGTYAGGAYAVNGMRHRVAILKPLNVIAVSLNPADTVIRGEGPAGSNAVRCIYLGEGGVLTGFTLTNGNTRTSGDVYEMCSGGGAWCEKDAILDRCRVAGNSAGENGGGVFGGEIRNSVLVCNSAGSFGGGLCLGEARNCTMMENTAFMGGGARLSVVRNSILYYNTALRSGDNFDVGECSDSCVVPDPGGQGNMTDTPAVSGRANPALLASSPCIDAGAAGDVRGSMDYLGKPRVIGAGVDIGCDEFLSSSATGQIQLALSGGYTNAVAGTPFRFENALDGRVVSLLWNWGDGSMESNNFAGTHAYTAPGNYSVVLTASNQDCQASVTVCVQVVAGFTNYVSLAGGHLSPYTNLPTAATNIQAAISAAVAGGTVIVSPGTYGSGECVSHGMRNRIEIGKPLVVTASSGDPADTVIKGNGPPGEAAVRCVYVADGGRLTGFTLTNGYTQVSGDAYWQRSGGGAWCEKGGIIERCHIVGNEAEFGGGVFRGTIQDCIVSGNSAEGEGGGLYLTDARGCVIAHNRAATDGGGAYGGDIYMSELSRNIAGHGGGGVCVGTVSNCLLTGNEAIHGGGMYGGTGYNSMISSNVCDENGGGVYGATIYNCVVASNSARMGGGSYGGTVRNCTIVSNLAWFGGGTEESVVRNSIVFHNNASSWDPNNSLGDLYSYSCTDPVPVGSSNITNEPRFAAFASGDFRLTPFSPCVDAGANQDWMFTAVDFDGNRRVINGTVDMGAHETPFYASPRVFLQGAYDTNANTMATVLRLTNAVPPISPYAADRRVVTAVPSNVADWVLVRLRDTNGAAVASRSAFLNGDGYVVTEAGTTGLVVDVSPGQQCSLLVQHRNHLSVMSANPIAFTNVMVAYDFTTNWTCYYGGSNACVELEPGVWGMIAGDADGDGKITPADRAIVSNQVGRTGYLAGDLNLDGVVSTNEP